MAHALILPDANPIFQSHPNLSVHKGQFTYHIETRNGRTTYSVSDGTNTMSAPVSYAFGGHNQTYLLQY